MVTLRAKLYFDGLLSPGECLQKLRAAIQGFGTYLGEPLAGAHKSSRRMLEQGDLELFREKGCVLGVKHGPMGRLTGTDVWTMPFHCFPIPEANVTEIVLSPALVESTERSIRAVGEFMFHALPRLVRAMEPDVAMMNGLAGWEAEGELPDGEDLRPGGLPPFFTPWVYLGPGRLTANRRRWLAALPAYRTEQLGEGWIVQAVPDLLTRPAPDFLKELRDGFGMEYRQV